MATRSEIPSTKKKLSRQQVSEIAEALEFVKTDPEFEAWIERCGPQRLQSVIWAYCRFRRDLRAVFAQWRENSAQNCAKTADF